MIESDHPFDIEPPKLAKALCEDLINLAKENIKDPENFKLTEEVTRNFNELIDSADDSNNDWFKMPANGVATPYSLLGYTDRIDELTEKTNELTNTYSVFAQLGEDEGAQAKHLFSSFGLFFVHKLKAIELEIHAGIISLTDDTVSEQIDGCIYLIVLMRDQLNMLEPAVEAFATIAARKVGGQKGGKSISNERNKLKAKVLKIADEEFKDDSAAATAREIYTYLSNLNNGELIKGSDGKHLYADLTQKFTSWIRTARRAPSDTK
jgi:hypothetical protein